MTKGCEFMEIAEKETSYTVNDAMNILLSKLDEAIDEMEDGRVQSIEAAWQEIDVI